MPEAGKEAPVLTQQLQGPGSAEGQSKHQAVEMLEGNVMIPVRQWTYDQGTT